MNNEKVWFYAAAIAIYFISWLFKKIKGSTEGEEDEEPPQRTLAEVQENRKRHLQRQAQREAGSDDASEALRKLFESIGGVAEEEAESFLPEPDPKPVQTSPPPLQRSPTRIANSPPPLTTPSRQTVSVPQLSAEEKKALANLKSRETSSTQKRGERRSNSLRSMTRGRGLRQAVVLKEILDQPRSLRPY